MAQRDEQREARREAIAAALAALGWTESGEDGAFLVFHNPALAEHPVVWDPDTGGDALASQLQRAGVSGQALEQALREALPGG